VPRQRRNGHACPVRMWGFSSLEIASLGSVLYGTKWLFRCPHVQDPAFHSKRRIAEGMDRRGSTIDHCRSRCKGRWAHPLYIHTYILNFVCFQVVSLGMYTAISSFFPCSKSTVEVIFLNAIEYRLQFPSDIRYCFKTLSLQFHFQCGKQRNHKGLSLASRVDGEW
jgi:hypothetical protein